MNGTARPDARARRRGFTLAEVAMSALVLMAVMTTTVELLGWMVAERRSADRRERAVEEAANAMERLAALPWEDLTAEAAGAWQLSPEAKRALPGGELKVDVAADGRDDRLKRVRVEVRYRGRSGAYEAPVRLAAWSARRGGARP